MKITFTRDRVQTSDFSLGQSMKGDVVDLEDKEANLYIKRGWAVKGEAKPGEAEAS